MTGLMGNLEMATMALHVIQNTNIPAMDLKQLPLPLPRARVVLMIQQRLYASVLCRMLILTGVRYAVGWRQQNLKIRLLCREHLPVPLKNTNGISATVMY